MKSLKEGNRRSWLHKTASPVTFSRGGKLKRVEAAEKALGIEELGGGEGTCS